MLTAFDPLAVPKTYWRGLGWFVGNNPLFDRASIDAFHRGLETQSLALEKMNPQLAKIASEMADEFYGAAVTAFDNRK